MSHSMMVRTQNYKIVSGVFPAILAWDYVMGINDNIKSAYHALIPVPFAAIDRCCCFVRSVLVIAVSFARKASTRVLFPWLTNLVFGCAIRRTEFALSILRGCDEYFTALEARNNKFSRVFSRLILVAKFVGFIAVRAGSRAKIVIRNLDLRWSFLKFYSAITARNKHISILSSVGIVSWN